MTLKINNDEALPDEDKSHSSSCASVPARSLAHEATNLWRDPAGVVKTWRVGYHYDADIATVPMCFTPAALQKLLDTVGSLLPESGAKGFGPKDRMGFAVVEFDERGSRSAGGAVYRPDVQWGEERRNFHLSRPDESMLLWDGDLHSHPGHFGHPSGKSGPGLGDLGYVEEVFAQNEWMQWFFIPILTGAATNDITIHPWVCRRDAVHAPMLAELVVCDVDSFPEREFNPAWLATVEESEADSTVREESEGDISRAVHHDHDSRTKTRDGQSVLSLLYSRPAEPAKDLELLRHEYTKRTRGLVSEGFHKRTILTIGVGAGSYAVEKLARLCPARLKNCDFDCIEYPNLARTAYTVDDVGLLKVEALERRIGRINPLVDVISYPRSFTEMDKSELDEVLSGVDLIVGGTDRFEAQALINKLAVRKRIPAIFIGIHAGGEGGRVIWYVPGETGCYRCIAKERYAAAEESILRDGLNLSGMVGSLIDCQFIDMVALKIAVAILDRGCDSQYGRFYDHMRGRNDVVVRCHPDYEWGKILWDALLGDLPKRPKNFARELREEAFLAMDSVWLKGRRDLDCPVCGCTNRITKRVAAAYRASQLP